MTSLSDKGELARIKELMQELGVSPNKKLGQNFLINEAVIQKIITATDIVNKHVVEIGPGLGALTLRIKEQTDHLHLVEYDSGLYQYWQDKGFSIEHIDALKKKWSDVDSNFQTLISNLPYDISSSIVIHLSTFTSPIQNMVLMFQKEVAQRITAGINLKNYGLLSVIAQNTWDVKKIADLRPRDFYPAPKVESRVLLFEKKPEAQFDAKFLSFVKHCFLNRRKMVIKNLKSYGKSLNITENTIEEQMLALGVDLKSRAENITPEKYLELFTKLKHK